MPEPIQFTSATPRFALPLLFSGQAQKEFFVNEAHALLDLLLHPSVEGAATMPPATPVEGEIWLITGIAQNEWVGMEDSLAAFIGSRWLYAAPQAGMRIFLKQPGQSAIYNNGWETAPAPIAPSGGTTVDVEARDAIAGLIDTLRTAGILAQA